MNKRLQLLGLVGSGKSHIARQLATTLNGHVVSFAQDVYRLAEIAKGAPIDKRSPADRHLLKLIGTSWGRESKILPPELEARLRDRKPAEWGSPDIWARLFVRNVERLPPGTAIINDDTRFENELRISAGVGFMPAFVKCTEQARLHRLRLRGEHYDSNDPQHKSEELINHLNRDVLDRHILPVVWNDSPDQQPTRPWVYSLGEFTRLVVTATSNESLALAMGWSPSLMINLQQYASDLDRVAPTH